MKNIKEMTINELAEYVGNTRQTLFNWMKHDDEAYRIRYEALKLGAALVKTGYTTESVIFMAKYGFNPSKQKLLDELEQKNKELNGLKRKLREITDEARDLHDS